MSDLAIGKRTVSSALPSIAASERGLFWSIQVMQFVSLKFDMKSFDPTIVRKCMRHATQATGVLRRESAPSRSQTLHVSATSWSWNSTGVLRGPSPVLPPLFRELPLTCVSSWTHGDVLAVRTPGASRRTFLPLINCPLRDSTARA